MDLPSYFILDELNAYTSHRRPKNVYFEGQVKPIGYSTPIKVVSINPLSPAHIYTTHIPKKNIPVYKSNLQKCVRRQLSDRAVRTAYAMLAGNTSDFLRRLPIVMIEDVLPHPSIIPLVWWMMASTKGYMLSDAEVSYILGIVYTACTIGIYQVKNSKCQPQGPLPDWTELPQPKRDLLWALEFRKAYRGMHCDVTMIEYLQRRWFVRLSAQTNAVWELLLRIPIEPIDLETLGECNKSDIILEAIDQHCFPWIIKRLSSEYSEEQVRGAIWYYRSRLNYRAVCPNSVPLEHILELEPVYLAIKSDLDRLSQWIFDHII